MIASDPTRVFGERLRQLRRRLGWSQERLALESDLDRSYVGSVERGERNISLVNIHRLAAALKLPPSELLGSEQKNGRRITETRLKREVPRGRKTSRSADQE